MADEFDLDAALAEIEDMTPAAEPERKPEPAPKAEAATPRAAMERAARPTVAPSVEPEPVPASTSGSTAGADMATAQREIGKQRAAFDAAYRAGVDRYRREHDPRDEAFREHNEEIAGIVVPVARTAMERAAYPVRKAWEGVVAADAAYDALPAVKDARARFADAENRPTPTERPKPAPARVPTIEMPDVPVKTPPSPGFNVTETFDVGEAPKREPSPAQAARRALVSAGLTVDEVKGMTDAEALALAEGL